MQTVDESDLVVTESEFAEFDGGEAGDLVEVVVVQVEHF